MPDFPRVSTILKEMILFDEDCWWLKPKYLRRGRLVDACASILASGRTIEADWFKGHSGESDDDRVEHEEIRPYLDSVRQFLAEHPMFQLEYAQLEVVNDAERYVGHPDWLCVLYTGTRFDIDLKCGEPPAEYLSVNGTKRRNPLFDAYRRQLALYKLASPPPYNTARCANLHIYPGGYKFIEHTDRGELSRAVAMVRAFHDRMNDKRGI